MGHVSNVQVMYGVHDLQICITKPKIVQERNGANRAVARIGWRPCRPVFVTTSMVSAMPLSTRQCRPK